EALDLFPRGLVTADAEFPPDDVRDEDAQGLAGPAGGTNRSCVGQVHVRAAVPVPFDLHRGEAFQGGDENSFRQDREAHSDRPFHGPLLARRGPHGHLLRHEDGKFVAVVDLRQFLDPSGDTLDLVVFQEPFHSACEKLAASRPWRFAAVYLDDEENPLWEEYAVEVVPTLALFREGKVADRLDGILGYGIDNRMVEEFVRRVEPALA